MSNRLEFPSPEIRPAPVSVPRKLCEVRGREPLQVLSVSAAGAEASRLEGEGICAGSRLRVVSNDGNGTVAVQCRTRLVILGRRFTYHVTVAALAEPRPPPAGIVCPGPWAGA